MYIERIVSRIRDLETSPIGFPVNAAFALLSLVLANGGIYSIAKPYWGEALSMVIAFLLLGLLWTSILSALNMDYKLYRIRMKLREFAPYRVHEFLVQYGQDVRRKIIVERGRENSIVVVEPQSSSQPMYEFYIDKRGSIAVSRLSPEEVGSTRGLSSDDLATRRYCRPFVTSAADSTCMLKLVLDAVSAP